MCHKTRNFLWLFRWITDKFAMSSIYQKLSALTTFVKPYAHRYFCYQAQSRSCQHIARLKTIFKSAVIKRNILCIMTTLISYQFNEFRKSHMELSQTCWMLYVGGSSSSDLRVTAATPHTPAAITPPSSPQQLKQISKLTFGKYSLKLVLL